VQTSAEVLIVQETMIVGVDAATDVVRVGAMAGEDVEISARAVDVLRAVSVRLHAPMPYSKQMAQPEAKPVLRVLRVLQDLLVSPGPRRRHVHLVHQGLRVRLKDRKVRESSGWC
jgi:hypothetical protein